MLIRKRITKIYKMSRFSPNPVHIRQRHRREPKCNHPPINTPIKYAGRPNISLEPQREYLTFSRSQKYTSFSQGKSRAKPIGSILLELQDSKSVGTTKIANGGHRLSLNLKTCDKVSATVTCILFYPRQKHVSEVYWCNTTPTACRIIVLVWLYHV